MPARRFRIAPVGHALACGEQRDVLRADGDAHALADDRGAARPRARRPPTADRRDAALDAATSPSTIVSTPTKRATSSEAGAQKTRAVSSSWRIAPAEQHGHAIGERLRLARGRG